MAWPACKKPIAVPFKYIEFFTDICCHCILGTQGAARASLHIRQRNLVIEMSSLRDSVFVADNLLPQQDHAALWEFFSAQSFNRVHDGGLTRVYRLTDGESWISSGHYLRIHEEPASEPVALISQRVRDGSANRQSAIALPTLRCEENAS
ncbi:hypothetical protein [Parerythrobacter lacustris]|uniref:Uncharacterized protein n=1 Tax=Parerythrobacter lacustris TaxID=2969984 RepID=A0ABT1XU93_9SPHN|nr:hypothetical protein [Parerythrobacter lacustris]MCR2835233.1 hypothetical protein [Parerythrobacter lacustris]